ncbi:hypothetical protein IJ096_02805 [Candidatus Saccharibacteria bacterium]|nr:hypothetical protein [Candidatus Saccharibacteria bacterium]
MQIIPILHNIRSTYNVGAILRTAEGFGCKEVIFSGYTPFPGTTPNTLPHISEKITRQIAKTALGAESLLTCIYLNDLPTPTNLPLQAPIIALENNIKDPRLHPLSEIKTALSASEPLETPKIAYLLLGEEVSGIDPALYPYITLFAEIPMSGQKESFNVSVAAGIALYELTK